MVTIVQESLEYLGYLNLYDEEGYFVGYGIFGGKTRAAIQLFQINHNIRPLNNKEFLLDENTVATIVLDAVLNGLTIAPYTSKNKQYQYCMNEFDIDYAYRDKIIKVMRNLDEYMLKAGVDYKETKISPYECVNVFDYTCVLEKVRQNADINFHKEYYMCEGSVNELAGYSYITYNNSDKICIRDIGIIRELGYMYSNVKAGAKYDIKDTNRWNELIAKVGENIYYYGNCFEFMYKGKIITAEDFGNILYGSYGNAAGFSLSALEDAGSLFSRINDGHFDYPEDTANITLGYNIFNENKYDYNYLHE